MYIENYKTLMKEIKDDKQMERYSMFLGRKNQYCENDYTTKCNLQIQCNSSAFFTELEKNFTILMETQKTLNSQSSLGQKEWNWRNQPAWLQSLLQSHSHQDSMVLAQRQKYRSMEQNRKPRDKSMHLWTLYLWQRRKKYSVEKRQSL